MNKHFQTVVGVLILLIKDNQVCLIRRFNTNFADGKYSLPGGHIDGGETIKEAMIREAKKKLELI